MTGRQDDRKMRGRKTEIGDEIVTVELTEMAQTGEAIGRVDGVVLFVPFGLPGDRATVAVTERNRNFARGRLLHLLDASPQRVTPSCPSFTICGGCEWQHIPYAQQLRLKENNVRTQLMRIGKLADPSVLACLPSPNAYGYRNHARLQRTATGAVGYHAARSHEVVAITTCPILEPPLEEALPHLTWQKLPADQTEIELRVSMPLPIGEYTYEITPGVFFQANSAVAALLVEEVLRALAFQGREQVLELYCGMGLFTVPIAAGASYVLGIEAHSAAIADAKVNAERAGVGHRVEFIAAPVERALHRPTVMQRNWDALVLDPPRAGVARQALTTLLDFAIPQIVYISCDPATLARDAQILCANGYFLRYAQPLDMFPQTHHVETVALFARA